VKFTNLVCQSFNESWFLIHECRLRAINRNKTIGNFNGTVLHPAYNIRFEGQIFKKENGYKPWLYKFNIDLCQFLKKPYNPLFIIFYKIIRGYTNFNHTCPYMVSDKKKKKYFLKTYFAIKGPQLVKGFHFQYELLQLPWPSGEYLLEAYWLFDNKRQLMTNIYGKVEEPK